MLNEAELLSPAAPEMSRREKDDNYCGVVCVLNEHWRVIRCKDGIQWIVQKRDRSTKTRATPRWRNRSYPRCREGIFADLTWFRIEVSPEIMAQLVALPDWIHQTAGVVS